MRFDRYGVLATLVFSIFSAHYALAADLPVKTPVYRAPPPLPIYTWTGFYVGANAGYGWGRSSVSAVPNAPFVTDFPSTSAFIAANHPNRLDPKGFTGGGQFGYNWQTGMWVLGLEADFNYFHPTASFSFGAGNVVPLAVNGSFSTNWLATVRPRIGIANDRWLVYATGGLAVTDLNYSESISVVGNVSGLGVFNGSIRQTKVGWTVGVGSEWAFAYNWSAKIEYLYVDVGSESIVASRVGALPPITPGPVFTYAADFKTNLVRFGLNYKFGSY